MFVVIAIPKPKAPLTSWLVELRAAGPFHTHALAELERDRLERLAGPGSTWSTRVVELVPPGPVNPTGPFLLEEPATDA